MEPLKDLVSPSVEKEKRMGGTHSSRALTPLCPWHSPQFFSTPPTYYLGPLPWHSLAVTPGLVLPPLSGSKGKAGSRDVKSSSTPGPTSRSFSPSTEGKEEVRREVTKNPVGHAHLPNTHGILQYSEEVPSLQGSEISFSQV
jgi:hypothetical protein